MTELDKLLIEANESHSKMKEFYKTFLTKELFVPVWNKPIRNETNQSKISPVIIDNSWGKFLILFDTKERFEKYATREIYYVQMLGFHILDQMPEDIFWALNHQDHYKEFSPDEIKWLKNDFIKTTFIDIQDKTNILIGKPKVVNDELLEQFREICSIYPEIKSAYLGQAFILEVSKFPFFILVLNTSGVSKAIEKDIYKYFYIKSIGLTNNKEDIIRILIDENNKESSIIMKTIEPFFKR